MNTHPTYVGEPDAYDNRVISLGDTYPDPTKPHLNRVRTAKAMWLQEAILQSYADGVERFIIPPGIYHLKEALRYHADSKMMIDGEGRAILVFSPGMTVAFEDNRWRENFKLEGFRWDDHRKEP